MPNQEDEYILTGAPEESPAMTQDTPPDSADITDQSSSEQSAEVAHEEVAAEEDYSDLAPKKLSGAQRAKLKIQRLEAENAALRTKQTESASPDEDAYSAEIDRIVGERLAEEKRREAVKRASDQWEQRKAEGRAKYGEEFDDAIESAPDVQVGVLEVLRESEHGSDMAFFLATHPEEIKKLNGLSPTLAARELGKLEARFEAKKQSAGKPKPPISKAPAAISPVSPARQAGARVVEDGYEIY